MGHWSRGRAADRGRRLKTGLRFLTKTQNGDPKNFLFGADFTGSRLLPALYR